MKKLFALVLALAMALAIAIPTMAAGWDPILPSTTPTEAITFKLMGLQTEKNTAVLGGLYEELTATYPLVKGTAVHFVVYVNVPAEAKLSAANKSLIANRYLNLNVACDNITLDSVTTWTNGVEGAKVNLAGAKSFTTAWGTGCYGQEYKLEFWGSGVTGGKDSTVKASLGYYNAWESTTFKAYNADGDLAFTVTTDNLDKAVATYFEIKDADGNVMKFPVAKGVIDTSKVITLKVGSNTYDVTRSTVSGIAFKLAEKVLDEKSTGDDAKTYAALKKVFDNYFAMLGFTYDGANAMTAEHFTKYFGTIDEVVNTLVYPAGYVTVTNPTVEPPQTGDATTVVGFVMIALALVAAAVVTVKKVRA